VRDGRLGEGDLEGDYICSEFRVKIEKDEGKGKISLEPISISQAKTEELSRTP
jgi:hypothetical protein